MDREVSYFVDKQTILSSSFECNWAELHHKIQSDSRTEIQGNREGEPKALAMSLYTSKSQI